jgi:hypothetical protein
MNPGLEREIEAGQFGGDRQILKAIRDHHERYIMVINVAS